MVTTIVIKKNDTKSIFITFKNLSGYPPLPATNKTLLIINSPLNAGVILHLNGTPQNGGQIMYGKQMMYANTGTFKIFAYIPYGYKAPVG